MKLSFGFIVTVVVLILVVLLTTCNSCLKYTPYSAASIGTPVEGFRVHSTKYTTYPDNLSIDSMNSKSIVQPPVGSGCMKIFGFNGLQCSPDFNDNALDIYSTAKGGAECLYKSSGLSNSMGPLCLDAKMNDLLHTRGGNQTGGPSVIGR
jgi:hypothetical protein